jgi:hypothetical protein
MNTKSEQSITSANLNPNVSIETAERKAMTMTTQNDKSITSDNTNNVSNMSANEAKEIAMNSTNDKSIPSDNKGTTNGFCTPGAPVSSIDRGVLNAALDKVRPAALALDHDKLIAVNLDVSMVASLAVAVSQRMAKQREYFKSLPDFDMEAFDLLETSGQALELAHTDYRYSIAPPDALAAMVGRASELRGILQHGGEALADGGLISKEQAATMRGGTSYRDIATAMNGWVRVLLAADWPAIKQRSMLTDAMLTEAHSLAEQILGLTGQHDLTPERIAEVADIRQRVFTLVVQRYDEVRRGASYMRWHQDDVDSYVPSLYSFGQRRTDVKPAPADTPVQPVVVAPSAEPTVKPVIAPQPVGMPGSSPFIS